MTEPSPVSGVNFRQITANGLNFRIAVAGDSGPCCCSRMAGLNHGTTGAISSVFFSERLSCGSSGYAWLRFN